MRYRTGSISKETQWNPGGARRARQPRIRYVASIVVHRERFRMRSTNLQNVRYWLEDMVRKYEDTPIDTSNKKSRNGKRS